MHSWTVVGYAYKADIYCPACVIEEVLTDNDLDESLLTGWSAEHNLHIMAAVLGFTDNEDDTPDEATYDSDEFPKVIFADQDEGEHCCTVP